MVLGTTMKIRYPLSIQVVILMMGYKKPKTMKRTCYYSEMIQRKMNWSVLQKRWMSRKSTWTALSKESSECNRLSKRLKGPSIVRWDAWISKRRAATQMYGYHFNGNSLNFRITQEMRRKCQAWEGIVLESQRKRRGRILTKTNWQIWWYLHQTHFFQERWCKKSLWEMGFSGSSCKDSILRDNA